MVITIREFSDEQESKKIKYVFGIDPGTGSKSACGVCLLDVEENTVVWSASIYPKGKASPTMPAHHRIKHINENLQQLYLSAVDMCDDTGTRVVVGIESFVMKGKSGETLAQFKGAVMSGLPFEADIREVQNTTVKKYAGNSGKADKLQIAEALKEKLPASKELLQELIDNGRWDEVDAIGIAWSVKEIHKL